LRDAAEAARRATMAAARATAETLEATLAQMKVVDRAWQQLDVLFRTGCPLPRGLLFAGAE